MKNKLQQLVIEYKKTKQEKLLVEIFDLLEPLLLKKSKYVYHQKFIKRKYIKRVYDEETKQYIDKNFVECFRLCEIKKVDLEDIISELKIEIFRIIDKYDINKSFYTYLISSIWKWRPEYIRTKQFITEIDNFSENNYTDEEGSNYFENLEWETEQPKEKINILNKFQNLSKQEKKFIKIKLEHPEYNQSQIAEILKVTQQRVSEITLNLRKKYNPHL